MMDDLGPIRPPRLNRCPGCGVNPAPPMVYGEHVTRRYVCDACRDAGQRRSDAMRDQIKAAVRDAEQRALEARFNGR